jgi:aminoglycoside/choline kinase family phosphotransferase
VNVADDQSLRPSVGKVLKVVTRSGDSCFVKWYRDQVDYQREWDALTEYTPALGSDAPRLIDNDESLKTLLISELPGEPAVGTTRDWDPLVHYKAGALIRRLHESSQPVVSDQFARQCAARFEEAAPALEGLVASSLLSEARLLIARAMDISAVTLVPAHRDNHPRNWMVDPGGHVRLLDFAMAEYDPWIVDVFLLEQDYWRTDPQLRVAFLSGYDREMTEEDLIMLKAHHAVSAARSLASTAGSAATKAEKLRARDMFDSLLGMTLF